MIGIIDWGIGGLGLYRELKGRRPEIPLHYFSDAGYTPYGQVPTSQLVSRLTDVITFLEGRGATSIILACNAASTVINRLESQVDLPITGIIESGVQSVLQSRLRSVGVIGGERTIRSGLYRRRLRIEGVEVLSRVAQPLSGLIERGEVEGEEFNANLRRILMPLRRMEGILLACTHYAAAIPQIQELLPDATIVDPVPNLAAMLADDILNGLHEGEEERFYTTGGVKEMKRGAKNAFGFAIGSARRVRVD